MTTSRRQQLSTESGAPSQREYRETLTPDSASLAWQEAIAAEAQKRFATQSTQPAPKPKPEPPKRPVITEHKEIVFTFSDGTSIASCTATQCTWGYGHANETKWRKTHSDRLLHPSVEVEVDESETEPEELELSSDVQELSVGPGVQPLEDRDVEDRDEDELEVAEPELGTVEDDEDDALAAYSNRNGGDFEC